MRAQEQQATAKLTTAFDPAIEANSPPRHPDLSHKPLYFLVEISTGLESYRKNQHNLDSYQPSEAYFPVEAGGTDNQHPPFQGRSLVS